MAARLPQGQEPIEDAGGIPWADLPERVHGVAEGEDQSVHVHTSTMFCNRIRVDAWAARSILTQDLCPWSATA